MNHQNVVVHCSASKWGDERTITKWHTDPPRNWSDCGYHFVINNGLINPSFYLEALNGSIEVGRDINKTGAHTIGYNHNSIGICLIGNNKFTKEQIFSLVELIVDLMGKYNIPLENVIGHYETPKANGKTCPNLDIEILREMILHYVNQDQYWFSIYDQLGNII